MRVAGARLVLILFARIPSLLLLSFVGSALFRHFFLALRLGLFNELLAASTRLQQLLIAGGARFKELFFAHCHRILLSVVSLSLRLKDLLGPVTRVKKKKKGLGWRRVYLQLLSAAIPALLELFSAAGVRRLAQVTSLKARGLGRLELVTCCLALGLALRAQVTELKARGLALLELLLK